jgi:hypothetical protein
VPGERCERLICGRILVRAANAYPKLGDDGILPSTAAQILCGLSAEFPSSGVRDGIDPLPAATPAAPASIRDLDHTLQCATPYEQAKQLLPRDWGPPSKC